MTRRKEKQTKTCMGHPDHPPHKHTHTHPLTESFPSHPLSAPRGSLRSSNSHANYHQANYIRRAILSRKLVPRTPRKSRRRRFSGHVRTDIYTRRAPFCGPRVVTMACVMEIPKVGSSVSVCYCLWRVTFVNCLFFV